MEPWQDGADEIHEPMADHVGCQIAPPQIKSSEDYTQGERDEHAGIAACPMTESEDGNGNRGSEKSPAPDRLKSFQGVAAKKKFLYDSGAQSDEEDERDG